MNPTQEPRVSVVITCFNLGQYLDEAVSSVLAQTYQNFEILIVDDGSTDAPTQAILAGYSRPKSRVIRAPHAGLAAARNLAIAQATGRYLCALDADDRLEPLFLEKMVRVLDDDGSLTFCSSWLRTFGTETWDWMPERCDLPTLLWENTVLTAALVRRDAVVAMGGYDQAMPEQGDEDWDLWLTLVERGHRGVILPEILFNYRRRAGSMSTVCWHGPGHLPLLRYRVAKHRATYDRYRLDVLLHQDDAVAALLRHNDRLERHIASFLEPAVDLRRQELAALRSKIAGASHVENLEAALRATAAEVTALRTSMSWRVTAPLRAIYGRWLDWRSRA
jgi:glycosyltransferase involved in cell wall biosynthesis